ARLRNEILLAAAAPLEDLVGSAQAHDAKRTDKAIAAIQAQAAQVVALLDPTARRRFERHLDSLRQAHDAGNEFAAAMAAVEAYRVLILSLDASALTIPVQVDELDYDSLKAGLLADSATPDWPALTRVTADAHKIWTGIQDEVRNDALRHLTEIAITSMYRAAGRRDAQMVHCAAQFTGAAVDLLEQQYPLWRR
ncbi:MAG: hypothetical protein WCC36_11795, partial [Gammaproteobacteria bacterium]